MNTFRIEYRDSDGTRRVDEHQGYGWQYGFENGCLKVWNNAGAIRQTCLYPLSGVVVFHMTTST